MLQRELLREALQGAQLLQDAYTGRLGEWPASVLHSDAQDGIEAYWVQAHDRVWLIVPGTGHGTRKFEALRDWLRNVTSQIGRERYGARWPLGFLQGAETLQRLIVRAALKGVVATHWAGHSLGAVVVAITWCITGQKLRGQRGHAIASPRACFEYVHAPEGLHSWIAQDDFVCEVPFRGYHVGEVHCLPPVYSTGEDHTAGHYLTRLELLLAAPLATHGALTTFGPAMPAGTPAP